ncbi:MAG: 50S ribosomal protein L25 [Armatimonadota bacterium]|nr:50S ribosomal protein L25 [Armatimonadota bacterium]
MERVTLKARPREALGKGAARSLRRQGLVPAVVYGRGRDPQAVAVDAKALSEALHTHAGMNVLIDLEVPDGDGAEPTTVVVKETQRDIFRHHLIHVDFHAISLTETIEMHVPVVLKGTARGVAEGGVLEHHLREVLVKCLPTQIPDQLELDVTELLVGRSLHASDLVVPEGVTLLTPPDEVIVTVVAPRVHEEAAPAAAAPAEAAAAVESAPAPEGAGTTTAAGKPRAADAAAAAGKPRAAESDRS